MRGLKLFFTMLFMFGLTYISVAQEQEETDESHHKNVISISLAHALIKQNIENGTKDWLIPAFMVDYNHFINEKWLVGIHSDFLLESFEIERFNSDGTEDVILEREYPVLVVGAVSYIPVHHLAVIAGGGMEFEKEENFAVLRLGIEPYLNISEKWDMIFNLTYDIKINGYDTWTIGVGIARLF